MDLFFTKENDALQKIFSKGFYSFMERKKLSTKKVAEIIGVSDSAVSSWKYGRSFPDVPNLFRLIELGFAWNDIDSVALMPISLMMQINDEESFIYNLEKRISEAKQLLEKETDQERQELWNKSIFKDGKALESIKANSKKHAAQLAEFLEKFKESATKKGKEK